MKQFATSLTAPRYRWRLRRVLTMAPLLSVSVVALLLAPTTTGAQTVPTAGEQGTNTALPLTSSAVTVHGRGNFSGLNITVNQTKNLENQDISVTWTGGPLTDAAPLTWNGTFADNYLQMFECWGDPQPGDPLDSVNPGPPPTQCEMGGESVNPTSSYPIGSTYYTNAYTRIMDDPGWSTYTEDQTDPANDWTDQATGQEVQPFVDTVNSGQLVEPFVSVDGTIVNQQDDGNFANTSPPQPFWLNPYFSFNTTNEVDFAQTYGATSGGTVGQQQFQVDTGLEAPGLGCGQDSETLPDGKTVVPQCWLVIVPRGTALQENPSNVNVPQVYTSPLSPSAWANRIAIPLSFNPVGGSCSIGANETRIEGNELAETAVSSWQPALCGKAGGTQYSYSSVSDDLARGNITNPTYGAAGMSVFSDPIPTEETDPSNPVVYAPLTLSGVAVAFNIDRVPGTDADGDPYPSEVPLQGTPVQNIYLTPLLVAKLLTESYQGEFQGEQYTKQSRSYAWVKNNPPSIVDDPDFLQYNPEFTMLQTGQQQAASTLVVEESSSDAAVAVWKWILSDPAAVAWLDGKSTGEPPGDGTMTVNPLYSTNPAINPSHVAFGTPTPEVYPQNDPYCYSTGEDLPPPYSTIAARPLCVLDWSPFALNMKTVAQDVATSNNGAKTTLNLSATTSGSAWTSNGPQVEGSSFIVSITDSASAARYGDQVASLSPAGDDANPTFIAPTVQSLLAGERAMNASGVRGVLQPNPSSTARDAYPLPMLTYAAVTPETLPQSQRQSYANFLDYAVGPGQVPGVNVGQLPNGYAPLPADLVAETTAAEKTILSPPSPSSQKTSSSSSSGRSTSTSTVGTGLSVGSGLSTTVGTLKYEKSRGPLSLGGSRLSLESILQPLFGVGFVRWTFLAVLVIGAVAALAAAITEVRRRRKNLKLSTGKTGLEAGNQ